MKGMGASDRPESIRVVQTSVYICPPDADVCLADVKVFVSDADVSPAEASVFSGIADVFLPNLHDRPANFRQSFADRWIFLGQESLRNRRALSRRAMRSEAGER